MTTKEAAQIWGLTEKTVKARCKAGMIPLADLENGEWIFPDDAVKPILTRGQACKHFQAMISIQDGAVPRMSEEGFIFLQDAGFITKLNDDHSDLAKLLHGVRVTLLGQELVAKEEKSKKPIIDELKLSVQLKSKHLTVEAEAKKNY